LAPGGETPQGRKNPLVPQAMGERSSMMAMEHPLQTEVLGLVEKKKVALRMGKSWRAGQLKITTAEREKKKLLHFPSRRGQKCFAIHTYTCRYWELTPGKNRKPKKRRKRKSFSLSMPFIYLNQRKRRRALKREASS